MCNLSNRNAVILGILVVVIIMLPYLILREDAFITIHDFLDSNPVHVKTILTLGLVGNPDGVLPVLNGVPSLNYVSLIPIDIKTILYILLPLYWAIVYNIFFVRLMAFLGMYVLCYNYINKRDALCSFLVATLFCLIPFYADYGLSSAGVPLFIYCILNLEYKRKLLLSYVLIVFFACNSSLILVGVFLCLFWSGWIVYRWLVVRTIPKNHIIGMMLLVLVYLFVNISTIYDYFFPTDIISHRVEFVESASLKDLMMQVFNYFLFSQYHAGAFCAVLILLITLIIYVIYWKKEKQIKFYASAYILVALLVLFGTLVKLLPLTITHSFQFDRFYFLYPSLCLILLAKAFSMIHCKQFFVFLLSVVLSIGNIVFDRELLTNVKSIIGNNTDYNPSFKIYFDEQLFGTIKKDLRIDDNFTCKVVSLGMYPSVAEYNNFYTLDSYVYSYPLDYKHDFRKVIANELNKNASIKSYFDDWGSRCYLFSSELAEIGNLFMCSKKDDFSVKNLNINTEALKNLGCEFIISAVDIANYKNLNLDYVNSYTTDESYWNIRVYRFL